MNQRMLIIRANVLMFFAALIWGSTFVAQRIGMEALPPIAFSGLRFALGSLALLPLALAQARKSGFPKDPEVTWRYPLKGAVFAGLFLFVGINLQQVGLVSTTAGKAGFITGLYVILVPIIGYFFGQRVGKGPWAGVVMGVLGLYLLSVTRNFSLAPGDGWVLISAFAWAGHVLVLGHFSPRINSFVLAFGQAAVCAILSLALSFALEDFTWGAVWEMRIPLLYGSLGSVALGFTFQVLGQKHSPPVHAAVILQLEAPIAALSGWLYLGEDMTGRSLLGAILMFAGMMVAQLSLMNGWRKKNGDREKAGAEQTLREPD